MPETPAPRPVGRPATLPAGTKHRAFRVTDAEWEALKQHLRKLRKSTKTSVSRRPEKC